MAENDEPVEIVDESDLKNAETEIPKSETTEQVDELENADKNTKSPKGPNILRKFLAVYKTKKKLSIPLTIFAFLLLLLAIPLTRYAILGLVIKKNVLIYTVDSSSKDSVFNSNVTIDGKKPFCGADKPPYPNCFAKVSVGRHKLKAEAGFYEPVEKTITVGLGKSKEQNIEVPMVANGRVVYLRIGNKVNSRPVEGARIKAGSSESITNERGDASIVVDPSLATVEVEISRDGYVAGKVSAKVGDFNAATLTPAGKLYFLSKKSGKIDVVKTDLDGGNRQTVLPGTGDEEETNTILLASRDWKYLALLSRRDNGRPKVYLIETSNDSLTEIDSGNAEFALAGWHDHTFVYSLTRNEVKYWEPRRQALKSYNAETKKLTVLDESLAFGNTNVAGYQTLDSVNLLSKEIIYIKNWQQYGYSDHYVADKQDTINTIAYDGSSKKEVKQLPHSVYPSAVLYKPDEVYFRYYNPSGSSESYLEYEDGKIVDAPADTAQNINKAYPTYLLSPGGNKTFWFEERDGKNTLFRGNQDGSNPVEIASLSEYIPYGWYTDDYLLISKSGSELYILSVDGLGDQAQTLKVTDYHKPSYNFRGYGYGYGGF